MLPHSESRSVKLSPSIRVGFSLNSSDRMTSISMATSSKTGFFRMETRRTIICSQKPSAAAVKFALPGIFVVHPRSGNDRFARRGSYQTAIDMDNLADRCVIRPACFENNRESLRMMECRKILWIYSGAPKTALSV